MLPSTIRLCYLPSQPDNASTPEGRLLMPTLREMFHGLWPRYVERYPQLPLAHRKVISAIGQCQSGHYAHSLYQCHTCGGQHRVQHSCGNRHCPRCQQQKTQQWLQHHLDKQLPGPHFLLTFTCLRRSDPSSVPTNAPPTRPCSTPGQRPSNGWPKTSASLEPTCQGSPGSCTPGAGSSSTTPTSTTSFRAGGSQRTARPGVPPEPTSLSRSKRSPPSTAPLQRRDAPRRSARAD